MANYKLKKWYPSLPKDWEEGMEVGQGDRGKYSWYSPCNVGYYHRGISREEVENNPEFWKKVVEKDYEILSFSSKEDFQLGRILTVKEIDSIRNRSITPYLFTVDRYINSPNTLWNIHSVKRLSDGEVFTVGDEVINKGYLKSWKIGYFNIEEERLRVYAKDSGRCPNFNNIQHVKKPLFTTEDGVDVFEGDEFWYVTTKGFNLWTKTCDSMSGGWAVNAKKVGDIPFSTKEAAEEYILMNKKQFSINDFEKLGADKELIKQAKILANEKI